MYSCSLVTQSHHIPTPSDPRPHPALATMRCTTNLLSPTTAAVVTPEQKKQRRKVTFEIVRRTQYRNESSGVSPLSSSIVAAAPRGRLPDVVPPALGACMHRCTVVVVKGSRLARAEAEMQRASE